MKFYLRMEGVNLANFVYDTQDLSTIRGGGLLLLDSVKTIENALPRSASVTLTPITTGASSGLFEFEAPNKEAAEDVCRAVEAVLNKDAKDAQLKHATFVVDVQPAGPDFVADREAMLARNRWHQMSQPALAIPAQNTQTIVRVCEIDHVRPATDVRPGPESTEEQVSVSVKARSKYGRERKHSFYGDLAPRAKGWHFAHDLNELTADKSQGNLHWKMAVVYLDGNGFGKLQNALCATPDIQRQFDKTLKNYRADALDTLLKAMSEGDGWASSQGRYRLETLLWGGDELIWVVPAWQGWKTLWLFYQQSRKWNFEGHPLTHAGGIVFCHHNASIHRITALAKGLAEIAKEKSRAANLFAYLILESFDHVRRDLGKFLQDRYYGGSKNVVLSGDATKMEKGEKAFRTLKLRKLLQRRKLHDIVYKLQQNERTEAKKLIENVTRDSDKELADLRNYFGDDDAGWQHILELWDYVGV